MADIDTLIAGAGRTNANFDFDSLINKPARDAQNQSFRAQDQQFIQQGRDLFKNGVPKNPDGTINYGAVRDTLLGHGDVGQAVSVDNLDLQRQNLRFGQGQSQSIQGVEGGAAPPGPQSSQPIISPSTNRGAPVVDRPPPTSAAPSGQYAGGDNGKNTVASIVAAQGIGADQQGQAIISLARQLGVDPNQPIDVNDPQIRNVLAPAVQMLRRGGGQQGQPQPQGQPPQGMAPQQPQPQQVAQAQPPQPMAQPQPQPQPQQPVQPQGTPQPATNAITSTTAPAVPSRAEQLIAYYSGIMSDPRSPKQNVELAKTRLEDLQKKNELTPDQKNYAQYKLEGGKGTMQDFLAESEAGKAAATERAKADVKEQQEYIDSGKSASQRLTTLNAISNVVNNDKNVGLGFAADTELKAKMALQRLGFDFGDLSGGELIQKMNAALASEMVKGITSRPTQFEFKTFLGNNPGLLLDKSGNQRLIGIFSQLAKREIDLGRLARQNRDSWDNWDSVVQKYDAEKQHQIVDPITKQPIYTDSIVAPSGQQKGAANPAAQQFKEGDTATNPRTGAKAVFKNGGWQQQI